MLRKILRFCRMHENKIFFAFLKEEFNLKFLRFVFELSNYFRNVSEKTGYFNTRSVSYRVNLQPDITQNW
jgi:hypothetical protein